MSNKIKSSINIDSPTFKNNSEVISLNDPLSWISVLKKNAMIVF